MKLKIFLGVLTVALFFAPEFVITGYVPFVIPGIILTVIPSLFFYLIIADCIKFLLGKNIKNSPFFLSIILGCLAGLILNYPIYIEAQKTIREDVSPSDIPKLSGTIAFKYPNKPGNSEPICDKICQNLLFNGAAKNILIASQSLKSLGRRNAELTGFTIENDPNCNIDEIVDTVSDNVLKRVTAGECIKKFKGDFSDINYIYEQQNIEKTIYKSRKIFGSRLELFSVDAQELKLLYRHTIATGNFYMIPFSFGPIPNASGGNFSAKFDIFTFLEPVGDSSSYRSYRYETDTFKKQNKLIFGDFLDEPKSKISTTEALAIGLKNPATSSKMLNRYVDIINFAFLQGRSNKLNEEELAVLTMAIRDKRVTSLNNFHSILTAAKLSQKLELYRAAIDRFFSEPLTTKPNKISAIAEIICRLPELLPKEEKIEALKADTERKNAIIYYYKKQIADGWSKTGGYEKCITNWQ